VDQAQRIHRGEHRSPFVRVMADPLRLIYPTFEFRFMESGHRNTFRRIKTMNTALVIASSPSGDAAISI
jgi:hypothetical protein